MNFPWLSFFVFFPAFSAGALLLLPKEKHQLIFKFSFVVTALESFVSLLLWNWVSPQPGFQMQEHRSWIPELGISYQLGIDGLSLPLVILTTLLSFLAVVCSYRGITERVKEYFFCLLLLESGMLGVFLATDLFLFYVFWEAMLIPMYFLIGVWGSANRLYAAIKFFLYTLFGSVLMLAGILVLYFYVQNQTGIRTFDLELLSGVNVPKALQTWLFLAFAVSFAIKVPLFPFHTWLPDAHVEAPTAGSVILAGILLKMGTYGFLRFCFPFFPDATVSFVPLLCVLALIGIVYGGLVAWVQKDFKKLVAYSSVSHLGFVVLGIFSLNQQGLDGATLQMLNHGLSTGALFLLVGMLYERTHTRLFSNFGGLAKAVPSFSWMFLLVALSSIGLPPLNGFVGEFLILLGAFKAQKIYAVIAATGVVISAVYLLTAFQHVMHGPVTHAQNKHLKDLSFREKAELLPLLALIVVLGIFPNLFLQKVQPTLASLLSKVQQHQIVPEKNP